MNWKTQPELTKFDEAQREHEAQREDEAQREMAQLLADLPSRARQAVDLPERFWRQQQIGIQSSIATRPAPVSWPAFAFATALMVLIGAMLFRDLPAQHNSLPRRAAEISDQQLLMKVEYTLQSDVPVALEPAALLAKEIEANANNSYSQGDHE